MVLKLTKLDLCILERGLDNYQADLDTSKNWVDYIDERNDTLVLRTKIQSYMAGRGV